MELGLLLHATCQGSGSLSGGCGMPVPHWSPGLPRGHSAAAAAMPAFSYDCWKCPHVPFLLLGRDVSPLDLPVPPAGGGVCPVGTRRLSQLWSGVHHADFSLLHSCMHSLMHSYIHHLAILDSCQGSNTCIQTPQVDLGTQRLKSHYCPRSPALTLPRVLP